MVGFDIPSKMVPSLILNVTSWNTIISSVFWEKKKAALVLPRAVRESMLLMVRRGSPAAMGRGGIGRPTWHINQGHQQLLKGQCHEVLDPFIPGPLINKLKTGSRNVSFYYELPPRSWGALLLPQPLRRQSSQVWASLHLEWTHTGGKLTTNVRAVKRVNEYR